MLVSNQSTHSRRYFRYAGGKRKRHLYLTDAAYQHLVDLANSADVFPSEVAEQIIRNHISACAIPTHNPPDSDAIQLTLLNILQTPSPEPTDGLANSITERTDCRE